MAEKIVLEMRGAWKYSLTLPFIELNKIYKSAAVASAELNILKTSITSCLHKRSNTAGGYH